jgi:hypothetical protein
MTRISLAVLCTLAVGGCASRLSDYVRTDGGPVDAAQEKATLAQCKGEGARAVAQPDDPYGRREREIVNACMARNGYIQAH